MGFVLVRSREGSQPWSLETEDPLTGERSRVGGNSREDGWLALPESRARTENPREERMPNSNHSSKLMEKWRTLPANY